MIAETPYDAVDAGQRLLDAIEQHTGRGETWRWARDRLAAGYSPAAIAAAIRNKLKELENSP